MGIRSALNWSGTIVDGVLLGEPAVDEVTGEMHWDGGVPNGVLDAVGLFLEDGVDENGDLKVKYDLEETYDVKYKTADVKIKIVFVEVPVLDDNGDPVVDENGDPVTELVPEGEQVPWFKGEVVEFEGNLYEASKDTLNPAPDKDWKLVKAVKEKVK